MESALAAGAVAAPRRRVVAIAITLADIDPLIRGYYVSTGGKPATCRYK
jgi:hypothetical protein